MGITHFSGIGIGQGEDAVTLVSKLFSGSASLNPASISDGDSATATITVTGAKVGDFVLLAPGVDLQGMSVSATVIDNNTVEVVLTNNTGGAIDLASATWKALVIRA